MTAAIIILVALGIAILALEAWHERKRYPIGDDCERLIHSYIVAWDDLARRQDARLDDLQRELNRAHWNHHLANHPEPFSECSICDEEIAHA